jgi:hypothetical protein
MFLTAAVDEEEWSASYTARFTAGKRDPVTHLIGGWVGPRANLDAVGKRESPCPCRESKPSRPARSSVTILTDIYKNVKYKHGDCAKYLGLLTIR